MKVIAVNGELRSDLGKKATKEIRRNERIPCVMYGGDEAKHFSVSFNDIRALIYTPDFKIAEISLDGSTHRAIVKDVQFHPVTDSIRHIDFLRLVEGHSIKLEVPIRFKGTSPGAKLGGKLMQKLRRVRIKTTPEYMIEEMVVDISGVNLGQSIRVRDIEPAENVEIMNNLSVPVATIEIPRALRSATSAAEKQAGGVVAADTGEGDAA
jgi:large subunit ribosomal protein L25